jgi:hypothetical protein
MMLSQIVKKQAEMIAARKAAEAERGRKPAARPSARAAPRPVAAAKPKPAPRAARPEAAQPAPKVEGVGAITLAVRVDAATVARMERLIAKEPKRSKKSIAREALRRFLAKYVLRVGQRSLLVVPRPAKEEGGVTIGIQVDAEMHRDLLRWCELSGFTKRQVLLAALRDLLFPDL